MKFIYASVIACMLSTPSTLCAQPSQPASGQGRRIINLRGDLYGVQDGDPIAVFFVTPDGIILVDPLNEATALWLKEELGTRFPGRTVRYVVYTHHDFLRSGGAAAFESTAEFVGHEQFNRERLRAGQQLPSSLLSLDRNRDGVLQRDEFETSDRADFIRARDVDSSGGVTPSELHSQVSLATVTFEREETIVLGGQSVRLLWVPISDDTDTTVVVFPAVRVAFSTDLFPVRSLPERIGPATTETALASLRALESTPFDMLLTGSGELLKKAEISTFREYVEELRDGVRTAFGAGNTLRDAQNSLSLPRYQHWTNFTTARPSHIAQVYSTLNHTRTMLFAAGTYGPTLVNPCAAGSGCTLTGTSALGAAVGMRYQAGRIGFAAQVQIQRAAQSHRVGFRSSPQIRQYRDIAVVIPFSYAFGSDLRRRTATLEGGPALITREEGETLLGPFGFFRQSREFSVGWSFGTVLRSPLGSRFGFVFPVYLMNRGTRNGDLGKWRFIVGGGLTMDVSRGVH